VGEEEKRAARQRAVAAIDQWLDKFDVVVVGPGLGRDDLILSTIAEVRSGEGGWLAGWLHIFLCWRLGVRVGEVSASVADCYAWEWSQVARVCIESCAKRSLLQGGRDLQHWVYPVEEGPSSRKGRRRGKPCTRAVLSPGTPVN
jgi:hypothetical protein